MRHLHGVSFDACTDADLCYDNSCFSEYRGARCLGAARITAADPGGGTRRVATVEGHRFEVTQQHVGAQVYPLVGGVFHVQVVGECAVGRGDFHFVQSRFADGQGVCVRTVAPQPRDVAAAPCRVQGRSRFHFIQAQDDGVLFPAHVIGWVVRQLHLITGRADRKPPFQGQGARLRCGVRIRSGDAVPSVGQVGIVAAEVKTHGLVGAVDLVIAQAQIGQAHRHHVHIR